ncbi:MAG TPA: M48 family metalloprotease [Gammaproteobacteria bacterium]
MRRLNRSLAACMSAAIVWQGLCAAQPNELPDFGTPADSVLSKSREAQLGRSVMLQLRNAGAVVEDPQLTEYISLLGSQLASQANDGDFEFEFFVVGDDRINAFALPGGHIGVNAGLILASDNESELAGVLAHEVSHVTQRHIARSLYDNQRTSIISMAAMLAAVLLGAAADLGSQATSGLLSAGQAAMLQRQINFTRAHEAEADRVGMDVLAAAGFDPSGMAAFFEKLSRRASLSSQYVPEMLQTHPVSTGRIAEARSRARQLPRAPHEDSVGYALAKARLRVLSADTPEQALAYFEAEGDSDAAADRYGRALSLIGLARGDEADRLFRELIDENPHIIAYRIGQAEALMSTGLTEQAMDVYAEALELSPRNVPLVISYADALIASEPARAHAILLDLLNNVRPTPAQIELIARAANAEGDVVSAYHYMSEYYASIGDLRLAIAQLRLALEAPEATAIERARFEARMREFIDYLPEEERPRAAAH